MHTSLRIKKAFFDAIRSGEKNAEFRSVSERNTSMLIKSPPISEITFHYQKEERLTVKVKSIKLIKRPKHIDPELVSDPCYRIQLIGVPRLWRK